MNIKKSSKSMNGLGIILSRFLAALRLMTLGCLGACAAQGALAGPATAPPGWTDDPPRLSRWVEEGWTAERLADPLTAAARYCDAARFGSAEAQYRLAALFLAQRPGGDARAEALALLSRAAQAGHAAAGELLAAVLSQTAVVPQPDRLPDCLTSGVPPRLEAALEPAVPHEVVAQYIDTLSPDKRRHAQLIQRLAPRFAVDGRLALAIARAESNFEARAVSPRNAQGLMQLIPDTAERFGVRNPFDPEQNVRGGLSYLRWLLDRFDGDVALVCAAYNAGEGVVDRYGGVPPYPETRAYVQRILHFYRATRHPRPGPL